MSIGHHTVAGWNFQLTSLQFKLNIVMVVTVHDATHSQMLAEHKGDCGCLTIASLCRFPFYWLRLSFGGSGISSRVPKPDSLGYQEYSLGGPVWHTAECVHFEFCLQRKPLNFRFYGRSFAIAALVGKEYKRVQQKYNNLILFCSKFAVFRLPLDRRGHYLARIWRQSRWTVSRLDVGGKDWRSLVVSKISINLVDFLNGKVHVRGRLFEMDKPSLKFRSGFKPMPRTKIRQRLG